MADQSLDSEFQALATAYNALKGLSQDELERGFVLLAQKLGVKSYAPRAQSKGQQNPPRHNGAQGSADGVVSEIESFDSAAEFVGTFPELKGDKERILAVAAYLQRKNPNEDLTGFEINRELKHMGNEVANITNAISRIIDVKPQLMIQTRKTGSGKQAKKFYRVTNAGFKHILELHEGRQQAATD